MRVWHARLGLLVVVGGHSWLELRGTWVIGVDPLLSLEDFVRDLNLMPQLLKPILISGWPWGWLEFAWLVGEGECHILAG